MLQVPNVLLIDTEGWDGMVLKGAAKTLSSGKVGYILFEINKYKPCWNSAMVTSALLS